MNKPQHPVVAVEALSPDYSADGFGWANAQAQLLRDHRWDLIDLENIVEEIESVGKSEQSAAESALRVLMMHIIKWQMQPERRGRSWAISIETQRAYYQQKMRKNPSLEAVTHEMRADAYHLARLEAAKEMDVPAKTVALDPPSWDVILDQPFEFD